MIPFLSSLLSLLVLTILSEITTTTHAFTVARRKFPAVRIRATDSLQAAGAAKDSTTENDIENDLSVLVRAAETKSEDPDVVLAALEDLEKKMRQKAKEEFPRVAEEMQNKLTGDWRLIFTTGTKKTQEKISARINYFPIKAVQSFRTNETPMLIENGIYLGEFWLIKFSGTMEFELRKRRLSFDFDKVNLFNGLLDIPLKQGQAAELGSKSGLGSESNVENNKRGNSAFFNWISADDKIATARGGGGGLALWKRV